MARDSSPLEMLGTHAERREIRFALWAAGAVTFVALVSAAGLAGVGASAWLTVPSALLVGWVVYRWLTRRVRRRRLLVSQPFPAEWEAVLQQDVVFYRSLDESGRTRFRRELQVFLGEKRITGIKTTLDTTTRVLAGASAIIPGRSV